jgi:lysophospholipase L1-like esterase
MKAALGVESLEDKVLLSGGSAQLVSAKLLPAIADARGPSSSVPVEGRRDRRAEALLRLPGVLPAASVALSTITRVGKWQIQVKTKSPASNTVLTVTPPAWVGVVKESYPELTQYNATLRGPKKGTILRALQAQEGTVQNLAGAQSIEVFAGDARQEMVAGTDYQFDPRFGTIGRLAGGAIAANEPVFVSYSYLPLRIDAIVRETNGSVVIRQGEPSTSMPQTPVLAPGELLLGRIWWRHVVGGLTDAQIFPITDAAFPALTTTEKPPAQTTLTKIWSKLENGQPIKILAWGDSVTDGSFLPNPTADRWQNQFVTRLRQEFPRANITLDTESWRTHNSSDYLNAPRGSAKNFAAHVLALKPDLVISEFVNDAGYSAAQTKTVYETLLTKFQGIDASWIILTPNYTAPEHMNFTSEKSIDRDPRPYVDAVRAFARSKNILLGDAARLWGRLWRQGFPYSSLLINGVNHPNALGMRFYADVLMDLF